MVLKVRKNIFSLLLCIILVLFVTPGEALAENTNETQSCEHEFVYEVNDNDTHTKKCIKDCDMEEEIVKCSGGTATCEESAACQFCGDHYGGIDNSNHVGEIVWSAQDEFQHIGNYSCCGVQATALESHSWSDGVCLECGNKYSPEANDTEEEADDAVTTGDNSMLTPSVIAFLALLTMAAVLFVGRRYSE